MSPLFGPSPREREHLVETLESLGPTSITGLSVALSWTPRRTEKVVREVVRRSEAPILFDPHSGSVRIPRPGPVGPPTLPERPNPRPDSLSAAYSTASMPTVSSETGRFSVRPQCPVCHVRLESTGTGETSYCPRCGRLDTRSATNERSAVGGPGTPPPLPGSGGSSTPRADRRAQEMFAAWVTQSPIPCPKCRSTLKHQSFGHYSCPRCGQTVTFANGGLTSGAEVAAVAPPA